MALFFTQLLNGIQNGAVYASLAVAPTRIAGRGACAVAGTGSASAGTPAARTRNRARDAIRKSSALRR